MSEQLTLYETKAKKRRVYNRASNGRFATRLQSELEHLRVERDYYKIMYESEQRKMAPVLKRLVSVERELNELKAKL